MKGLPDSVSHCARPTRGVFDRALRELRRPIRLPSLTPIVVTRARSLYNPAPAPHEQTARLNLVNTPTTRPSRIRWLILALLFLISVVTYIDRGNISVTAHQMMQAYGMTDQEMGQEKGTGGANPVC